MSRFSLSRPSRLRFAALSIAVLFGLETLPNAAIAAPHAPPQSPATATRAASPSTAPPPSEALAPPPETTPPVSLAAEIGAPGTATAPTATAPTATAPNVTEPPLSVAPAALDLSAPAPTGHEEKRLYERWWFWTAIAAVAITTVVIVAATSGPTEPRTDLGNMVAF